MDRFTVVGVALLALCAGCTQATVPPQPVTASPTAPSSAMPPPPSSPVAMVLPPPARDEVAREVRRGAERTATPGEADLTRGPWVVEGACDGPVGFSVSYIVTVDDKEDGTGSINCSAGKTYANSALVGLQGRHRVAVVFGAEVEQTTAAYVRIIPERSL